MNPKEGKSVSLLQETNKVAEMRGKIQDMCNISGFGSIDQNPSSVQLFVRQIGKCLVEGLLNVRDVRPWTEDSFDSRLF